MTRRGFLSSAAAMAAQPATRPNIVFILADDLGYGDVGCFGQTMFATPNIDRLASEGMRFTHVYAGSSVCAPSRCCLMTGKHTGHATVRGNSGRGGRVPLRADDVTVAEVLKSAGYRTGLVGKWGLGEAGTNGVPNLQGFDEFYGFLNQDHALEYYPTHLWNNLTEHFPSGNQGAKRKQFVQDLFTDRAIRFIRENRQRPFFLYLAYTIPHASSELGRDTGDGYPVPSYAPYESRDWPKPEKGFAASVTRMDADIGRVLAELKAQGVDQNTLVIFSSDNGPASDGGHRVDFFKSAGGLRGRKSTMYEGGLRVPAVVRWPARVPSGRTSNAIWAFWDLLPSVASLTGAPAPRNLDGVDVSGAWLGGSAPNRSLYWELWAGKGSVQAMRHGDWKAIRQPNGSMELFHLGDDPAESRLINDDRLMREMAERMRGARIDSDDFPLQQ